MNKTRIQYIGRFLLVVQLLFMLGACSDDDYKASVKELRLVRVTPSNVYTGDIVSILGRNFSTDTGENYVYIDETPAQVIEAVKDEIKIIMPAMEPGRHIIRVKTASGDLSGLEVTYLKTPDHEYLVSTIVGRKGVATCEDGVGTDATTKLPSGLAFAPDGSIWFTDRGFNAIRRISPDYEVTTLGKVAIDNGSAVWQGGFNSKGEYYFIDKAKGMLRKFNPADGKATTIASGMKSPMNVAFDSDDNMYVSARDNKAIYKFTPDGIQSTFATLQYPPNYCTFDRRGNMLVGVNGYVLLQIAPDGTQSVICGDGQKHSEYNDGEPGNPLTAAIGPTFGVCAAADGSIYYADNRYHVIRHLVPDESGDYSKGTLETIMGTGKAGYADGKGLKAAFNAPYEIIITEDGKTMYIAGAINYVIRSVSIR